MELSNKFVSMRVVINVERAITSSSMKDGNHWYFYFFQTFKNCKILVNFSGYFPHPPPFF